jgi:hypothetical protein
VSSFFTECYSIQEEDTWKVFTAFDDIREKYTRYCRAINAAPESDRSMANYLKNTLGRKSERPYEQGVRKRGYYGLFFDKEAFETIISNYTIIGTDTFSLGQIGTDNGTDKQIAWDTRTDKTQKYPVQILSKIYSYIDNKPKISVPSVHVSHDSERSVPNPSHDLSHFASDGRNLDEEGDWEDCDVCGLPLPPAWQRKDGNSIYCQNCLENVINRRK